MPSSFRPCKTLREEVRNQNPRSDEKKELKTRAAASMRTLSFRADFS